MKCTLKAYLLRGRTNGIRYTLDRYHCYFLRIFYLQILPLFHCLRQYFCIWLFAVESRCRFIATYAQMDVHCTTNHGQVCVYYPNLLLWLTSHFSNQVLFNQARQIGILSYGFDTKIWFLASKLGTVLWTETWLSLIITLEWQCVINTIFIYTQFHTDNSTRGKAEINPFTTFLNSTCVIFWKASLLYVVR